MNRRHPKTFSEEKAIEATAAAWLAQRDDHLTPDAAAAFARWRGTNPRHEAAVQRLEKTWSTLQQLRNFRPELAGQLNRDLLSGPRKARVTRFPFGAVIVALAAGLVLAAVIGWPIVPLRPAHVVPRQETNAHFATTTERYQRVALSDGSVVELNAHSEIRVDYSAKERRVRLLLGEANFIVAKNKLRPFWVEAGEISVRAVGTAFNVRLGSREVEVLVTEGKVAVKTKDETGPTHGVHPSAAAFAASPPPEDSCLVAGQRLIFSRESPTPRIDVQSLPAESIRNALGWQGMRLHFVDTPLAEVARQFNRQNPVQLEIADASLATLPVDGSFRADNVEAFVRLLESNGNITAERIGTDRIIVRKTR